MGSFCTPNCSNGFKKGQKSERGVRVFHPWFGFQGSDFPALQSKTYLMIPGEVLRLTAVLISGA